MRAGSASTVADAGTTVWELPEPDEATPQPVKHKKEIISPPALNRLTQYPSSLVKKNPFFYEMIAKKLS